MMPKSRENQDTFHVLLGGNYKVNLEEIQFKIYINVCVCLCC